MQFTLLIIGVLALLPAAFCAVITSGHADISAIGAIVTSGHADISARQSGVAGWPGPTDYDVIGCFCTLFFFLILERSYSLTSSTTLIYPTTTSPSSIHSVFGSG